MLIVVLLATGTTGCTLVDTNTPVQRAVTAIDDALAQMSNQSDKWRDILQNTIAKLTDQAQATIRNELTDLMQRTIATVGTTFQCGIVDFLGTRVREHLESIKAHLLGQPAPAPHPTFCQPVPSTVDVRQVRSGQPDHVDFFGYDFDTTPPLKLFLEKTDTSRVDLTPKLIMSTHYQVVLPFGANGVQLGPDSKALRLSWNGVDLGSIAVVQPSIPQCIDSTVFSNTGNTKTTFDPVPKVGSGDADFWQGGNIASGASQIAVNISVTPVVVPDQISATISMRAEEKGGDGTTIDGSKTVVLYRPPLGATIKSILSGGTAFAWSTAPVGMVFGWDNDTREIQAAPDSIIKLMDAGGFSGGTLPLPGNHGQDAGHAAGTTAGVEVTWSEMKVVIHGPPPGVSACSG